MRQNFGQLQEITSDDLNSISSRAQRFLMDTILYNLMGNPSDGFFGNGFKVSRVSSTEVSISAGLGIHLLSGAINEPTRRPIFSSSSISQLIPTANPSLNRIDIICVKSILIDGETENRKVKDAFTSEITTSATVVSKEWGYDIQLVEGVADASPAAPAIPAGYVKMCEILVTAASGVASESSITDSRNVLPIAGSVGETGNREYDAVIGDTSLLGYSHETLKAALDDSSIVAGSKILVTRSEDIGAIPEVTKDNIEIVFKPSVTFYDDGAGVGLRINADGVKVTGGRFDSFTTGIDVVSGTLYNLVANSRFNACTSAIDGMTGKNSSYGLIEE